MLAQSSYGFRKSIKMIFSSENIESCTPPMSMESRAVKNNKQIYKTSESSDDNSNLINRNIHSRTSSTNRKDDTLVFNSSTFLLSFSSDDSLVHCPIYAEKNDDISESVDSSPLALLVKYSLEA